MTTRWNRQENIIKIVSISKYTTKTALDHIAELLKAAIIIHQTRLVLN